ncbi:hypothetical protein QJS10_CPA09g01515 [Acorus calamus]|uniref:Uncharacterized protein n=1 Tax=Acorus calamus TaxID=4465 RepID=A0AAV9E505_ACOCL|nr:hypothetical protein QJS10_CPA09g01515 [Acorus calamus]
MRCVPWEWTGRQLATDPAPPLLQNDLNRAPTETHPPCSDQFACPIVEKQHHKLPYIFYIHLCAFEDHNVFDSQITQAPAGIIKRATAFARPTTPASHISAKEKKGASDVAAPTSRHSAQETWHWKNKCATDSGSSP